MREIKDLSRAFLRALHKTIRANPISESQQHACWRYIMIGSCVLLRQMQPDRQTLGLDPRVYCSFSWPDYNGL